MPYRFIIVIGLALLPITMPDAWTKKRLLLPIMPNASNSGSPREPSITICVSHKCSSNARLGLLSPNSYQAKPQQFRHRALTASGDWSQQPFTVRPDGVRTDPAFALVRGFDIPRRPMREDASDWLKARRSARTPSTDYVARDDCSCLRDNGHRRIFQLVLIAWCSKRALLAAARCCTHHSLKCPQMMSGQMRPCSPTRSAP